MRYPSAMAAAILLLTASVAQAQAPAVTLSPVSGNTIQAGNYAVLQADYSSASSSIDLLRIRLFVGGQDWTGRFARGATRSKMTLSNSDRIVAGQLSFQVFVPDAAGEMTSAAASYIVQPRFTDATSIASVGDSIQLFAHGLDSAASNNSVVFTTSSGTLEAPFESVDANAKYGKVTVPDGAIDGNLVLKVNGVAAPEVRHLNVSIVEPDVAITLPVPLTITVLLSTQFRVDYGTAIDPIDPGTFRFTAKGQDWSSRFTLLTLYGTYTAPATELVGGPFKVEAEAAHGPALPIAKVSRLLLVLPKFLDITPKAEPGDTITVWADGLDPVAEKNVVIFTGRENSRIEARLETVDIGQGSGTVIVPIDVRTGDVRLTVNDAESEDEHLFTVVLPVPDCGSLPTAMRQMADGSWYAVFRRNHQGPDPRCPEYTAPPASETNTPEEEILVRFPVGGNGVVVFRHVRNLRESNWGPGVYGIYAAKQQNGLAYVVGNRAFGSVGSNFKVVFPGGEEWPLPQLMFSEYHSRATVGDLAPDGRLYFIPTHCQTTPTPRQCIARINPQTGTITEFPTPITSGVGSPAPTERAWTTALRANCDGYLYVGRNVDALGTFGNSGYAIFYQIQKVDPRTGLVVGETGWSTGWIMDLLMQCDPNKIMASVYSPPWDFYEDLDAGFVQTLDPNTMQLSDPLYAFTGTPFAVNVSMLEGAGVPDEFVLGRSGKVYWHTTSFVNGPNIVRWDLLPQELWVQGPVCAPGDAACAGALPYCLPSAWPGEQPGEGTESPEGDESCSKNGEPNPGAGNPIDVVTGAVFFSQTDAVLAGIRSRVPLTRSYNSRRAALGKTGPFGRGWEWSVDKRIEEKGALLLLRRGNSSPVVFEDTEADGTWRALEPRSERSTIAATPSGYERTFPNGRKEQYNAEGLLLSWSDRIGTTGSLGRSSSGQITTITVPGGRNLILTYDGDFISSITGPSGLIANYEYDNGLLSSVTYADGRGYVFDYDPAGRVLSVTDHTGKFIEKHTYDSLGRGLTSEHSAGRDLMTFEYLRDRTMVRDATGGVIEYIFTTDGGIRRLERINGPCQCSGNAQFTAWLRDPVTSRIAAVTTSLAPQPTLFFYDDNGNLIRTVDPQGRETLMAYDAEDRLLTSTAPDNGVTELTHGPAGVLTIKDPLNRITTFEYDGLGQLALVRDPRGMGTELSRNLTGEVIAVEDPLNHATTLTYDSSGRLLSATDAQGRTTAVTRDSLGRVSKVEKPGGKTVDLTYDASGRRTEMKDENGRVTRITYDAFDRVLAVTDPMRQVTRYEYDLMGRVTALTDAKGQTTRFQYDEGGRLRSTRQPDGKETAFEYDSKGRLRERADQAGRLMTYSYDEFSRITGVQMTATPAFSYSYDGMDRLETMANGTDTLTRVYNLAGEVVSEASERNQTLVSYTYDDNGSRASLSLDQTVVAIYGYDDASRLTSITRGPGVFGFGYDTVNRRTSMTFPNGVNTTYSYENLAGLTGIQAVKDAATISTFTYAYDFVGNRTSKNVGDHTENYGYDDLDRLIGISRTGVGEKQWRFGYDAVGNRTSTQVGTGEVVSPTFNNRNQTLQQTVGGALVVEGTLNEEATVNVNGSPARMLTPTHFEAKVESVPGTNTLTVAATDVSGNLTTGEYEVEVSGTPASYTYDAVGNLISKTLPGETWTYSWDALNQLTSASKNGVIQASFRYDPLGRRAVKSTPTRVTSYTYDGADILRENVTVGGVTTTSYYVHGPSIDEPLAKEVAGVLKYYHADALGSIVKETSAAGAVTATLRYDAWGNIEAGARDGFAFTGREWDPETGLYYYRARYYDPKAGTFISEDPLGLAAGPNKYQYVEADPVTGTDPSGLWAYWCRSGSNVQIAIPITFTGAGEDPSNAPLMAYYKDKIEEKWSGQFGEFKVTTTVIKGSANQVYVDSELFNVGQANKDYVYLGSGGNVFAHEAGHWMGLIDMYDPATLLPLVPGYENNIMVYTNKHPYEADIETILADRRNINRCPCPK